LGEWILRVVQRRGRHGLLFLDGHADFYQPEAVPNGEAASMELALGTGRGPIIVTDLEGRRPLVRDEDVVVFGRRDAEVADALPYASGGVIAQFRKALPFSTTQTRITFAPAAPARATCKRSAGS
jgi:arginase family enzyme